MSFLDTLGSVVDKQVDGVKGFGRGVANLAGADKRAHAKAVAEAAAAGAPPPEPPPPVNPARVLADGIGIITGAAAMPLQLLNTGFATATNAISAVLPDFPAAFLGSMYIGAPHAHGHPPSLIPPAPPVPLPSLGPVVLGTCVSVLINGLPAARAGDNGLAPTCGGIAPIFEIATGSSKVFIGGTRAARAIDICKACQPGTAGAAKAAATAMSIAQKAGAYAGIAASAVDAAQAPTAGEAAGAALNAAMQAAQMAADAAAKAVMALMGSDPAIPPSPGMITVGAPNVLIGGFPMINFPDPAKALFKRLKALRAKVKANKAKASGGQNHG